MMKPKDYDNVTLSAPQLPAGGYVCRIINVEETMSKTGKEMLIVSLDIAEGEHTGHYAKAYRENTSQNAHWGCNMYIMPYNSDGTTSKRFKGFVTAAEKSNDFEVTWGNNFANCLKGKLVGVLFGREQFRANNGQLAWSCKPKFTADVERIRKGDFKVPEDEPYEESFYTDAPLAESDVELPF